MAVRVCETKDVPPGEARRYSLDGREVAVVNLGDEGFRALDAICSHAKYYLDEGEVDVDLALVQVVLRVAADRVERAEPLVAQVHDRDLTSVEGVAPRLAGRHVFRLADAHGHQRMPSASSAAIAASAPTRTSSICTRSSTSWKNPVTISRSASSWGIPRDSR